MKLLNKCCQHYTTNNPLLCIRLTLGRTDDTAKLSAKRTHQHERDEDSTTLILMACVTNTESLG